MLFSRTAQQLLAGGLRLALSIKCRGIHLRNRIVRDFELTEGLKQSLNLTDSSG